MKTLLFALTLGITLSAQEPPVLPLTVTQQLALDAAKLATAQAENERDQAVLQAALATARALSLSVPADRLKRQQALATALIESEKVIVAALGGDYVKGDRFDRAKRVLVPAPVKAMP